MRHLNETGLEVREARDLVEAGHKEIVVSGISVGLYGRDTDGPQLSDVMRQLAAIPGLERLRLSSLHPRELTDELLEVWADSPNMMPHIHLPLQSAGATSVLTLWADRRHRKKNGRIKR